MDKNIQCQIRLTNEKKKLSKTVWWVHLDNVLGSQIGYNIHKPGLKTGMESGTFWKTEIGLTG